MTGYMGSGHANELYEMDEWEHCIAYVALALA